jgi:GntR family transcriptional regulator, rspAB operon transcriptional repressor
MLREEIYSTLRREILACVLPPGMELREQELASRFEVSKSPVRDALLHLVRTGLVTVVPRQGYRVSPVSLDDARDMFALRQVLELACAAETVRVASDRVLTTLDRYRRFHGRDHLRDFIAYNREFHCALARCCGNARMSRATCELIEEMDRLVRISVNTIRGRSPERLVQEHIGIIDAVQARNAKLAVSLLRAHTASAERRLVSALQWAVVQPERREAK